MEKLEMIYQFLQRYGNKINPYLLSIKYVQTDCQAMVELSFNHKPHPLTIDLDFITGDLITDENDVPIKGLPLFNPNADIVDNARNLIELDDYSLINCIDGLFSESAANVINEQYLNNLNASK